MKAREWHWLPAKYHGFVIETMEGLLRVNREGMLRGEISALRAAIAVLRSAARAKKKGGRR